MKKVVLILILFIFTISISSCKEKQTYRYGDKEMLTNIWEGNKIYNETVVLEDDGTMIYGNLLYAPVKIISVRNYTLEKEYNSSEYKIVGNKIIRTETSTIPYLTTENLAGKNLPSEFALGTYQAKEPGTEIVFTEGIGIIMNQIAVSYIHEGTWNASVQTYQGDKLPNFIGKLKKNEKVTVVLNGDSISTGANSSGVLGIAPYLDDFGKLFVDELKSIYKADIELINTSLGGTLSSWGKDNVDSNINLYKPDLVIIGFGMNDGSWNIAPNKFKENIEFMIRSIKAKKPDADIILISTIIANPLSIQNSIQKDYLPVLKELSEEYSVGLVDMTTLSLELFKVKKGVDILANNINHPSDFLVRCYASSLITAVKEG